MKLFNIINIVLYINYFMKIIEQVTYKQVN